MFVYYYGDVHGTLAEVALLISDSHRAWSAWARLAVRRGEELRARIDPGSFVPAKQVEIEIGRSERRAGSVIIPIKWRATGVGAIFPVMNADIVLQPIGHTDVQVVFRGSYDPPLGGFGRLLDRAVMHRLAEASAKSFVDQLCNAVTETLALNREQDSNSGPVSNPAVDSGISTSLLGPTSETR